jgi:hypothetical protein
MSTYKVRLPGPSDAVLGSVPEQDLKKTIIAMSTSIPPCSTG